MKPNHKIAARRIDRPWVSFCLGLFLISVFVVEYLSDVSLGVVVVAPGPIVMTKETGTADSFGVLIRRDPLAALIAARDRHVRDVADYECILVKQELLPGGMGEEQEIRVKYRKEPYSVYMEWKRNPGLASRVLYVKGRLIDTNAELPEERELAMAQPGIIARMLVKSVKQPIHGRLAGLVSRRFVDDFGFQKTLDRLISVSELGRSKGDLTLEFIGEGRFDARPVWVLRRHLPYGGEGGLYPDRLAEILIDIEYRVPVAIYCYSDYDGNASSLLAKYEYRDIQMRAGLTDSDFEPATYGM